jgi:hypothetical protein
MCVCVCVCVCVVIQRKGKTRIWASKFSVLSTKTLTNHEEYSQHLHLFIRLFIYLSQYQLLFFRDNFNCSSTVRLTYRQATYE